MGLKLRIEIDPDLPEEVVIRAPAVSDEVRRLRDAVEQSLRGGGEIAVRKRDGECFLPYEEVLFFETANDRVWAHTAQECYACSLHLNELSDLLPRTFARAAKGCLINTAHIRSISRSPTGVGEATFRSSVKTVYISRMYYKTVRDTIEETRLH